MLKHLLNWNAALPQIWQAWKIIATAGNWKQTCQCVSWSSKYHCQTQTDSFPRWSVSQVWSVSTPVSLTLWHLTRQLANWRTATICS